MTCASALTLRRTDEFVTIADDRTPPPRNEEHRAGLSPLMSDLERRIRELEDTHAELQQQIDELRAESSARSRPVATSARAPAEPAPIRGERDEPAYEETAWDETPFARERRRRPTPGLEDLATPRMLAVAGGLAVTLGLAFLVSYGISQGWISESLRVVLAAIFSATLAGSGMVLLERRRGGIPAMALLLSGLVGLFLTDVAATRLYGLVSVDAGVALATLIGIAAAAFALHRGSEIVTTLAVGGTLISPALVGAHYSPDTLAFLFPVYIAAMALTATRRWPSLYLASFAIMALSVLGAQQGRPFTATQAFAVAFAGLVVSAIGLLGRSLRDGSEEPWLSATYGVMAAATGALGYVLITNGSIPNHAAADLPDTLSKVWLFLFAALNSVASWRCHSLGMVDTRRAALTAAIASFAWGLGVVFHGPALVVAWSAAATVTFIAARHPWERGVALAVLALAAGHALIFEIPIDALANGVDSVISALIAGGAIALACALARAYGPEEWRGRASAAVVGLLIYLVSVAIVDASQMSAGRFRPQSTLSALDSEARGQVIVSSLWALCGLALVMGGLRRAHPSWRTAGLALMALAGAKISLFDLASLSTAARTISFIVVGMVFLAAAFAYQAAARKSDPTGQH